MITRAVEKGLKQLPLRGNAKEILESYRKASKFQASPRKSYWFWTELFWSPDRLVRHNQSPETENLNKDHFPARRDYRAPR